LKKEREDKSNKSISMKNLRYYIAIGVALGFAAFTLFTLGERSVAADEFSMFWAAEKPVSTILKLYFSPFENNPAGCALVQHVWGSFFGFSDESLRILSLIFALGALIYLWKFVELYAARHSDANRLLIFLLAATTPVVWMSANFARYQSMTLLFGLGALFHYLRWWKSLQTQSASRRDLALYAAFAGLSFYFHYLSAAVFALCAGLHFLFSALVLRKEYSAALPRWIASQISILAIISPIIFLIWTTYSQMDLGASPLAATSISKPAAAALFFGATVFGALNGFAVAPWSLWVVAPMTVLFAILVVRLIRRAPSQTNAERLTALFFLFAPLVVAAAAVARMYPPLPFYLYPSIQRVCFVAPILWVILSMELVRIAHTRARYTAAGIALACNFYAVATWNFNVVATQHTPPIRELADFVARVVENPSRLTVAHPFAYRYGMESVGSGSAGSATAVDRYLPSSNALFWAETDLTAPVSVDSCRRFVAETRSPEFIIVRRNRIHANSDSLALALAQSGYRLAKEQDMQAQTAFDVWFKTALLRLPFARAQEDAAPQPYLYTVLYFRR
jgi:hypothetical protein